MTVDDLVAQAKRNTTGPVDDEANRLLVEQALKERE
jgi:hypothetical protein